MTKINLKSFNCPKCHKSSEFKMYETVNVDLDNSLREKVLSGDLFNWECPHCKAKLMVQYDFLYHDMSNKFLLYYSPKNCKETNMSINNMLKKYPGMRKSMYRTVDNYNQLIEKILIFESGLDDIMVELTKVLIKCREDNQISEETNLVFERLMPEKETNKEDMLVFRPIKEGKVQKGIILFGIDGYNQYKQKAEEEGKFKMTTFCDNINEDWILDRFADSE